MEPVVLVTGASGGIGLATAREFKRRGHRVLVTARKPEDLARLQAEGFTTISLEMTDSASVARAAEDALRLGPPTVLVNNAGYGELGPVEETTRERWVRQFETNVFGHFDLTRRLLPAMRAAGGGRILFVSSVVGRVPIPWMGPYSASKHAVEAAADALRVEVRPWNIRVTLIEPGPVDTRFAERAASTSAPAAQDTPSPYGAVQPRVERLLAAFAAGLRPEQVARTIARQATTRFPRRRVAVGALMKLGIPIARMTPAFVKDRVAAAALGLNAHRARRGR